jgi:hypothetical protein
MVTPVGVVDQLREPGEVLAVEDEELSHASEALTQDGADLLLGSFLVTLVVSLDDATELLEGKLEPLEQTHDVFLA